MTLENCIQVMRGLPINFFIIDIDAPRFTIIDGSDKHFNELQIKRENVTGRGVFEMFPDNEENNFDSSDKLLKSFMTVIETEKPHMITLQYDIPTIFGFEIRYWSVKNSPCFENGKLRYIYNIPTDITALYKMTGLTV